MSNGSSRSAESAVRPPCSKLTAQGLLCSQLHLPWMLQTTCIELWLVYSTQTVPYPYWVYTILSSDHKPNMSAEYVCQSYNTLQLAVSFWIADRGSLVIRQWYPRYSYPPCRGSVSRKMDINIRRGHDLILNLRPSKQREKLSPQLTKCRQNWGNYTLPDSVSIRWMENNMMQPNTRRKHILTFTLALQMKTNLSR